MKERGRSVAGMVCTVLTGSSFSREHRVFPKPCVRPPRISLALVFMLVLSSFRSNAMEFIVLSQTSNELYSVTVPLTSPKLITPVSLGAASFELIEATPARLFTFDNTANVLVALDRFSGAVLRTTPLDQDVFTTRRGFDLSPDGVLYGVLPGMQLRTIDPLTGTTAFLANITGAARVEAIAFTPDGTLYAAGSIADNASSETLFTLSVTTGELTPVGLMNASDVDDLTFAPDGYLYGVDSQAGVLTHLLRIDPATATVEDLGSTGVTEITGLVSIRQPIALAISQSGDAVVLHWPTNAVGFRLESSQSLAPAASWQPVPATPAILNDRYAVTLSTSGAEPSFFRLSRQ